jgi:hypothetical protein
MYRVVVICSKNSLYVRFTRRSGFYPARQVFSYMFNRLIGNFTPRASPPSDLFPGYGHTLAETYQIRVLWLKSCLDIGSLSMWLKCALIRRHFDLRRKAVYCNRKPMQIFNRKLAYLIL